MIPEKAPAVWRTTWFVTVVILVGTTGCSKTKENGEVNPPGRPGGPMGKGEVPDITAQLPGGEEYSAAKKVYSDNNCARCHKLGDTGGGQGGRRGGPPAGTSPGKGKGGPPGGFGRGPDLTKVGAKPEHTKSWIAEHIRAPKTHKPQSRMPAYGTDKITDADLDHLAEYLTSRK